MQMSAEVKIGSKEESPTAKKGERSQFVTFNSVMKGVLPIIKIKRNAPS